MIVCPKCGKELADGTKFCSKCGASLVDAAAPKAEAPKAEEPKAEAPKAEEPKAEAPKAEAPKAEAPKAEAPKAAAPKAEAPKAPAAEGEKPQNSKIIMYAGIAVAVVLVLILGMSLFSGGGSKKGKACAFYVKDKEIFYNASLNPKKKPAQITTKLVKDSGIDKDDLTDIDSVIKLSKDGKYLFFPDKVDNSGWTLYYRNLGNLKKEPIKVDSDIEEYYINDASTVVTYLKDSGDLWQFNLKKGERAEKKVAKDVSNFYVSDDGSQIYYVQSTDDGSQLKYWTKKSDDKIDSDVYSLSKVSKDFKTIYYVKEGKLYKKVGKKDKEAIAKDVYQVCRIYDGGEFYYVKSDEDTSEYTLIYFDGKNEKKVAEEIKFNYSYFDYTTSSQTPAIVYSSYDDKGKASYYVAIKDKVTELDYDDMSVYSVRFESKGKYFIFVADTKDGKGTLYKANVSGTSVKIDSYDDDVSSGRITSNGKIMYFKDTKNNKGDLYCDKKQIDSDVYVYYASYNENLKGFIYYVDYKDGKGGTLKVSKGGKAKSIGDDVSDFYVLPNGNVLYLASYKNYEGELWIYKGGKPVMMDEDVVAIIGVN